MSDCLLEVQNLTYTYSDGTQALKGVSARIERGRKIAVLGINGAGKSTFFLALNGVIQPEQGKILLKGQEVKRDRKSLMKLRKSVAIVFQDPDTQLFSSSVYQEVSFGALNLGLSEDVVRERVERAFEETDITSLAERPVHFLSYGQKKRVSVADVLVMEPEIIIFDEPTACLDPKHSKQMMQLFERLTDKGITVILSTHDMELAYAWAEQVMVFQEGKMIREGTPQVIFGDEELIRKAELEKPMVLEIYQALMEKGLFTVDIEMPKDRKQLIERIMNTQSKEER